MRVALRADLPVRGVSEVERLSGGVDENGPRPLVNVLILLLLLLLLSVVAVNLTCISMLMAIDSLPAARRV